MKTNLGKMVSSEGKQPTPAAGVRLLPNCTGTEMSAQPPLQDPQVVSNARAKLRERLSEEQQAVINTDFSSNKLVTVIAVAGAGKTRTAASLVVESMLDERVGRILVMSSMRSAANTALLRINDTLQFTGLAELGVAFSPDFVRTIHSLARQANRAARRPFFISNSVDDYLERAVDEVLAPYRLERAGIESFEAFWQSRFEEKYVHSEKIATKIQSEHPDATPEELGLMLYKKTAVDPEPVFEQAGFSELGYTGLIASLRTIRKEVMERWLNMSNVSQQKRQLILRAKEMMEGDRVVDQISSIHAFAGAKEPLCGTGDLLLVDEAQDLTQSQLMIVATTLKAGACVVLVGDPSQGITMFAGGSANPIVSLTNQVEQQGSIPVEKFRLSVNYRSSKEIVMASELALPSADRAARGVVQANFSGDPVKVVLTPNDAEEARFIGKAICDSIHAGTRPGDIAVLSFRNFAWKSPLCDILRNHHVSFAIRGLGKDTASPAGRVLPALQIGLGVGEFAQDVEDQATILQSFVRALSGCSFTEEVRNYVIEVAEKQRVTAVKAYLDYTDKILDLTERDHPSQWSGKRDLFGNKVFQKNTRKVNILKATITARAAVEQMQVWLSAATEGETGIADAFKPVGMPLVKAGAAAGFAEPNSLPPTTYVPVGPLASVALVVTVSYLKLDLERLSEFNQLLSELDDHEVDEESVDSWVGVVGAQLAKMHEVEEDKVVCLSTIHKFKGSERDHCYCIGMNKRFELAGIGEKQLEPYDGLHDIGCSRVPNCKCPAIVFKRTELAQLAKIERQRVAHVTLSRARKTLTISVPGDPGDLSTVLLDQTNAVLVKSGFSAPLGNVAVARPGASR